MIGKVRILRVRAGGQAFGLDCEVVRGIDCPERPVRLPGAPPYVRGVAEVREQVCPLVDLAQRLGLGPGPLSREGAVLIESAEPVALWVEGIEGVADVQAREAEPAWLQAGVRALGPDDLPILDAEALVDRRRLAPIAPLLARAAVERGDGA